MSSVPDSKREVVQSEGENLFQVPELPKDVVYCNFCNVDGDKQSGVFEGTAAQAVESGWEERNWGLTCPPCQKEVDHLDDDVVESGGLSVLGRFLSSGLLKKEE